METKQKAKVLHIITSLGAGGAQAMLCKILERLVGSTTAHEVLQLSGEDDYLAQLDSLGIPVFSLNMHAGRPSLRAVARLRKHVAQSRPDLIQGWMYHGNLAAEVARTLHRGKVPTVWNIRHSIDALTDEKRITRWIMRLGARISRRPIGIIYNSRIAAGQHESIGYDASKRVVIANGFDTARFEFSQAARDRMRTGLGIDEDTFLVGMVGRNHPIKDHSNLIESAILLSGRKPDIRYIIAGSGTDSAESTYYARIAIAGLLNQFHFLGEYEDIPALMSTIDVLVLPSKGEGFPNVLGEAMACERPCIATAVGDCAMIVGDCGMVVPPRDSTALADAIQSMCEKSVAERLDIGRRARQRIEQNYTIAQIANQYAALYESILNVEIPS